VARLEPLPRPRNLLVVVCRHGALARIGPYSYLIFLLGLIPLAFWLDVHTDSISQQNALGICAFIILFLWTRLSPPTERRQVWIMVGVATCVEIWSSLVWGIYRYRFGNVPLFVPWGHGLVYLFALRAARTPLMLQHSKLVCRAAYICAAGWAVFGLTAEPLILHRLDVTGAMFLPIFVWFMQKPSAPIYAAAFFVTSYLELWGTHLGNWAWQVYAPVSHMATGNPPSVISAGYCVMDFTSISIAALLPASGLLAWFLPRLRPAISESTVE
jgi:hypothetical protein